MGGVLTDAVKVGQKFGKLTVIDRVSRQEALKAGKDRGYWLARCDCGNAVDVRDSIQLTSGKTISCGCRARKPQMIDVTGMRFGILTAVELSHVEGQGAYWVFNCDCGEVAHLRLKDVRHGNTASCGCQRTPKRPPAPGKGKGWRDPSTLPDINRPWRKADHVDDRWLVLVGERCPKAA